ncbi:MAG: response regulator [Candidatus Pacebacteria bacterium]|jgi:DNA-binding response OmpR family regulator|nr:response regulator [Candidatus Paceibacterota bacterium]
MKKILIIEDEKMLTDIYEERFKREGFEVYSAVSAEEGLEKTIEIKPDLIILDILLPRGNGTDFLEKMKKIDDLKDIKVIAYSNYDDNETREKAIRLGAKEYLIKTNYTPKEILDLINKYIKE